MTRLFLIDKKLNRRIPLGFTRFNDPSLVEQAIRNKHPFIVRLATHSWRVECVKEKGPFRKTP